MILKREIYKQHIRDYNSGKFGDITLLKSCIITGIEYDQVIKFKSRVDAEEV